MYEHLEFPIQKPNFTAEFDGRLINMIYANIYLSVCSHILVCNAILNSVAKFPLF